MEGMQYIDYRVTDGSYRAILHWKVENGIVYVKEPNRWLPTDIPVTFVKDFELYPIREENKNT